LTSVAYGVVPFEVHQKLVDQTGVSTGQISSSSVDMDFRVSTPDALHRIG
jgi:hypothetical protein